MKHRTHNQYPFYFVLGAFSLYLVFSIIPGIAGIFYSFTDWSGYTAEINFIGLDKRYVRFAVKDEVAIDQLGVALVA